jgi:hypothetical protein
METSLGKCVSGISKKRNKGESAVYMIKHYAPEYNLPEKPIKHDCKVCGRKTRLWLCKDCYDRLCDFMVANHLACQEKDWNNLRENFLEYFLEKGKEVVRFT